MSEAFYGEIMMLPYTYSPEGWAYCDGQLMYIAQNQALYAVIGSMYGGDGSTTFAVPKLQGCSPISAGTGPGLTPRPLSYGGGSSTCALNYTQMPAHTHQLYGQLGPASVSDPTDAVPSILRDSATTPPTPIPRYNMTDDPDTYMDEGTLAYAGTSAPHENRQPYLALNFCICIDGVFPLRN
ncbi:phage tail protein [Vibrio navarrensis]|nr:phage tail protein [Vibrio navarrensis]